MTCNTTANGSQHGAYYIPEVTCGVTPPTPTLKTLRFTALALGISRNSIESSEIRADRQISCYRGGQNTVSGDLSIELSYGTFDDFIQAALMGSWSSDVVKAGTERQSFTIVREFSDLESGDKALVYTGCQINKMSLSITSSGVVTGSFGIIAKDQTSATDVDAVSAGVAPATDTCPMDSFTGNILEGGVSTGIVTEVSLELDNGINPLFAIGDRNAVASSVGKSNVSGSITAYFQNMDLYNKFVNETNSSLAVTLSDPNGNSYLLELPNVRYTGAPLDVQSEQEITLNMPFMALYDAVEGSNIVITRS